MSDPEASTLSPELEAALVEQARAVAGRAWAPASGFRVGAALLVASDPSAQPVIVPGCNVETASLGLTVCAERNAMFRAVADGRRELRAVAVWTPLAEPASPCGACRQVLVEFAVPGCPVLIAGPGGVLHRTSLDELLPRPFTFASFQPSPESP